MSKSKKGWFDTGFGDHMDKAEKEQRIKKPKRFWLRPGDEKEIIFLDDEPVCIWEHSLKIGGSWIGNEFTCRKGVGENPRCPLCQSNANRYYIGFLTILDHTGWKDKDGKWHRNVRQLLAMRLDTLKKLQVYKEKKKSLVGWKAEVSRIAGKKGDDGKIKATKNSAACGDVFDFVEKVDVFEDKEFFFETMVDGRKKKKAPEPYDYQEILKPLSISEMMALTSDGYGDDRDNGDDDDDDRGGDEDAV